MKNKQRGKVEEIIPVSPLLLLMGIQVYMSIRHQYFTLAAASCSRIITYPELLHKHANKCISLRLKPKTYIDKTLFTPWIECSFVFCHLSSGDAGPTKVR